MVLPFDDQPTHEARPTGRSSSALTSFVGRDADIGHLVTLITDPEIRLLTLTGPGGVGKTRIAEELIPILDARFPDGILFIELAAIDDPVLLPEHLLRAVGGERDASETELDALCNRIGQRKLLLILDNMEQLAQAATLVQEILIRCRNLTTLVTSRLLLRVRGEFEYLLEPLSLVQPGQDSVAPAVRMLRDRVRAIRTTLPADQLTDDIASAICRSVDGLPLAIELAAAQLRVLAPQDLLARLSDQSNILGRGPTDVPDRQKTMQAAVQWSVDLLADPVRSAFLLLSVFSGGFDLEAAQALTSIDDDRVFLDTIDELVSHNLVRRNPAEGAGFRFAMLETIRSYARERLTREIRLEAARNQHALLFIKRAELAGPLLRASTDDQLRVWKHIEADIDNYRSALEWLGIRGDWHESTRLVAGLDWFWTDSHYVAEGYRHLKPLVDLEDVASDPELNASALRVLATLSDHVGDPLDIPELVDRAIAAMQLAGRTADLPELLHLSSGTLIEQDKLGPARAKARETIASANDEEQWWFVGAGELNLALIETLSGDYVAARSAANRGAEAYRRCGDRDLVHSALNVEAVAWLFAGDYGNAQAVYQSVLAQQEERLEDAYYFQHVSRGIAAVAAKTGQYELAARVTGMAEAESERIGISLRKPLLAALESMLADARLMLGEERFTALATEGRNLARIDAVRELIALHEPPAPVDRKLRPAPFNLLSNREFEVLRYLVAGKSDPEIAAELFLSPRTVSQHVSSILGKLGVSSRTAAASMAATAKIR